MSAPMVTTGPLVGGWELIAAARQGDPEAFGQLYARYVPLVAGFLRRRVRDRALVEDLTSETFTRAFRAVGSVREQGPDVGAWLVTIARNLVCDHAKSHRNRREHPVADLTDVLTTEPGVEELVLARLAAADVRRQVRLLPDAQREVIRLRFGHGLSVTQTAAALGRTEAAVKALQHRGLTHLRKPGGDRR